VKGVRWLGKYPTALPRKLGPGLALEFIPVIEVPKIKII